MSGICWEAQLDSEVVVKRWYEVQDGFLSWYDLQERTQVIVSAASLSHLLCPSYLLEPKQLPPNWTSTFSLCGRDHGLLHLPHTPTSLQALLCDSMFRWHTLSTRGETLFLPFPVNSVLTSLRLSRRSTKSNGLLLCKHQWQKHLSNALHTCLLPHTTSCNSLHDVH
jgi:hypothetical protein